uniref:Uncharacterized protein n=1 Tax=Triticum urartu TaxID=4572 RepID=A0A8R7TIM4_TRIUA
MLLFYIEEFLMPNGALTVSARIRSARAISQANFCAFSSTDSSAYVVSILRQFHIGQGVEFISHSCSTPVTATI